MIIILMEKLLDDDDVRNYDDVGELSCKTKGDSGSIPVRYSDARDGNNHNMKPEQHAVLSMQNGTAHLLADYRTFRSYIKSLNLNMKSGCDLCYTYTVNVILRLSD